VPVREPAPEGDQRGEEQEEREHRLDLVHVIDRTRSSLEQRTSSGRHGVPLKRPGPAL
jgi:hypothetical protein